jgi:hypothetical protein
MIMQKTVFGLREGIKKIEAFRFISKIEVFLCSI